MIWSSASVNLLGKQWTWLSFAGESLQSSKDDGKIRKL